MQQNGPPDELLGLLLAFLCIVLLIALVVGILFLMTLHKALARCAPHNRTMEPGMVWLNLIPLFGLVWQFITVVRVGESLKNEFRSRGWDRRDEDYGKGLGIISCCLGIAGNIPYIGLLFSLGALITFIMYWVKIANFSGQLARRPYADYEDDDYEDDYDDRDDRRDRGRARERDRDRDDDYDRDRDDRDDGGRPWDRGGR